MISPRPELHVSMRRRHELVEGPLCAPVSYEEWQSVLAITVDAPKLRIQDRLLAATEMVERHVGRCLVAQTWDVFLDDFPHTYPAILQAEYDSVTAFQGYSLSLGRPPLLSVQGVYVTDDAGIETVVDPSTYWVTRYKDEPRISLVPGNIWPYHRGFEGFRVRMVCGYAFPFTVSANILNAPGHTLVNGQRIRIQGGEGYIPGGLKPGADYIVANVQGDTLTLNDTSSQPVAIDDQTQWALLGEIPYGIRRAVMLTASVAESGEPGNTTRGSRIKGLKLAPVSIPDEVKESLKSYRKLAI
jgi:hypothetical protein